MALAMHSPAHAQVVVGGDGLPQTEINQSVLDRLGPPMTLSDMFLGRVPNAPAPYPAVQASTGTLPLAETLRKPRVTRHVQRTEKAAAAPAKHHKGTVTVSVPAEGKAIPTVKTETAAKAPETTISDAKAQNAAPENTKPENTKPENAKPENAKSEESKTASAPVPAQPQSQAAAQTPKTESASAASEKPASEAKPALEAKPAAEPAPASAAASSTASQAAPTPLTPAVAPPAAAPAPAPAVPAAVATAVSAPQPAAPAIPTPAAPAPIAQAPAQTPVPPTESPAVKAPAPSVPAPPALAAPQQASIAAAPAVQTPTLAPTPAPTLGTSLGNDGVTIPFDADSAHLPPTSLAALSGLAKRLAADDSLQLQLMAYASGDEDNAGKARRLSLSRALAVRSYLMDQGVLTTRMEVRALGNKVPGGQPDRVDLVLQKR